MVLSSTEDIQLPEKEQLKRYKVERMWNLHDTRNTRFHLSNSKNSTIRKEKSENLVVNYKFKYFFLFKVTHSDKLYSTL